MPLLSRKRKPKRRRKAKPHQASTCAPPKAAVARGKGKAARRKGAKPRKDASAKAARATRGSSAGGAVDATAAAKRRAALKRDRAASCAPAKQRRDRDRTKKPTGPDPSATVPASPATATPAAPPQQGPAAATASDSAISTEPTTSPEPTRPTGEPGFGPREAQRLLWRASCGPRPGEVDRLVAMGRDAAVEHLLNPGTDTTEGPAPTVNGAPIKPYETWGHDHLHFLDGLVRGTHGLRSRMTLVWHDWFAASVGKVPRHLMLRMLGLLHHHALGRFDDLARDVTVSEAMLVFLDGIQNAKGNPNENYAREFFELFTLGANRDAYTEQDIREAARALTGWRASWVNTWTDFRFDATRHDAGTKTIFGQTGAFGWQDVVRLAVEHPKHASWFVTRLWRAFVGEPADAATQAELERLYVEGGRQVVPVLRAILKHPRFYEGPAMVVPPAVLNAGLLRALGRGIDIDAWAWIGDMCGQMLLYPPNVSGWTEDAWLGSATWTGRWTMANYALKPTALDPNAPYDVTETPATALRRALAHLGEPVIGTDTRDALLRFAEDLCPPTLPSWQQGRMRAQRQNALRMLIATSSDYACS